MRFALVTFFLLVPAIAMGQIIPVLESPLEIQITPENPGPGDRVFIEAKNIPQSGEIVYEWRIDGSLYDQGLGRNKISISAGGVGEFFSVSLSVYVNGQFYAKKERFVRPASVDIVWEGDTHTPPFYEGLPLPNKESRVRLLAVPNIVHNGIKTPPESLYFKWFINGSLKSFDEGIGLSNVNIKVPGLGNAFSVAVSVGTLDGLIETRQTTIIPPATPHVLVYEKTPLMGLLFNKAISNEYTLSGEEVIFTAFPYNSSENEDLTYTWRVGGDIVSSGSNPQELVLRREGQGRGNFTVLVGVENASRLFERFSKNFLLTF